MKKIVVHCASGLKNSGDEAILSALLKTISDENEVVVISLDKKYTQEMHSKVKVFNESEYLLCRRLIRSCDLFILGGGGLLQDETTIFNVTRWLSKLRLAIRFRKKTCLYANSIGPINYKFNKKQISSLLRKVDIITLRDKKSVELLTELGITENVFLTADPVFSYLPPDDIFCKYVLNKYGVHEGFVFISVRHWFDTHPIIPVKISTKLGIRLQKDRKKYEEFVTNFAEIVNYVNSSLQKMVVFCAFCSGRDEKIAQDIMNNIEDPLMCISLDIPNMTPEEYMALIRKSDFMIGMRLHSLIYSINSEIPFIALPYSQKVVGMLETIGLQEFSIPVEKISLRDFQHMLNKLLVNKEGIIELIQNKRKLINAQEKKNNLYLQGLLSDEKY